MEEVWKKEVEEKVIMPEEEIFARWRSSTATVMAMLSDEEFLQHKREEEGGQDEGGPDERGEAEGGGFEGRSKEGDHIGMMHNKEGNGMWMCAFGK